MDLYAKRTYLIDTENAFKIGPHIAYLKSQGFDVCQLNLGEPDFDVPTHIKQEIKKQLDLNNTHYCDPKGLLSLREAISQQINQTRGLNVSAEQVVVFPGAKPAIGFSQQVYCNPGDEVIYPSPGFPIFESFTRYLDLVPIPLHLSEENGFVFNAEQLNERLSAKTKLIILNFPSNPTGGVATQQQLEEIATIILKKCHPHVRIYSDEIYERIIFGEHKHHSIASIPGMEKRTIISSGFSKTYAWTGGRVGYAIFPSIEEANVFKNLNINYFSCIPPYNQEAAREALQNPQSEINIQQMVQTFEERRDYIVNALNNIKGVSCQMPNGAFYVFPNITKLCDNLNIIDAYQRLNEDLRLKTSPSTLFQMFALFYHHVAVLDRRSFGKIGAEGKHYLRLSYTSDMKVLVEGIRRLTQAAEDIEGFKKFMQEAKNLY